MGNEDTGDEAVELGVCEQYLDCVEAAAPEMYAAAEEAFGLEGSCWIAGNIDGDDCHTVCRDFLLAMITLFPAVDECFECVDDADCTTDAPYCYDDEDLCEEDDVLSCSVWEIGGRCFGFGDGFTHQQKRDWCTAVDEAFGPGWTSERSTTCKTNGAWGRCEYIANSSDEVVGGPIHLYYYYDHPSLNWTKADAEMECSLIRGGIWVSF